MSTMSNWSVRPDIGKRKKIMDELLDTEQAYSRDLSLLVEVSNGRMQESKGRGVNL
jgi:hypothetical protein